MVSDNLNESLSEGVIVTFGGVPAQSAEVVSAMSIKAVMPPHVTEEPVELVVKNADGTSAAAPDGFTYTAAGG